LSEPFWSDLEELVAAHDLVIDRRRGSPHPNHPEMIYPLDYGYIEGTTAGDGAGIDVWLGSLAQSSLTGILLTLDHVKKDAEIKILLGCTTEDVASIVDFHSWMSTHYIPNPRRASEHDP
jgi:inorganic pyrophosphatase